MALRRHEKETIATLRLCGEKGSSLSKGKSSL